MEQLKRILANVTREVKRGIDYPQVFGEVLAKLHAELCRLAGVKEDEVAILIMDNMKNLRFHRPQYLEKAGSIPTGYSRSFVTKVLQSGRPAIENRFHSTQHLVLFEEFKRNNPNVQPIQKMMCIPLLAKGGKVFGALEISKKGDSLEAAGPDWTDQEITQISKAVAEIVEEFYQLCDLAGVL